MINNLRTEKQFLARLFVLFYRNLSLAFDNQGDFLNLSLFPFIVNGHSLGFRISTMNNSPGIVVSLCRKGSNWKNGRLLRHGGFNVT